MPDDKLEKQLKASLDKMIGPMRDKRDKCLKQAREHTVRAAQFTKQGKEWDKRIRDVQEAMGVTTWTQRKIAAQSPEERSDVTPKG